MILLLDNYDSFTWNLWHFLSDLGAEVRTLRNDAASVDEVMAMGAEGIVLSPGPGTPAQAGIAEGLVSLIGICGLCAHFCITSALQLAPATVVTPFEFLRLPMVSVVGVWLYGEGLEWQVFVGALVVLGANWMNIRAETRSVQNTN